MKLLTVMTLGLGLASGAAFAESHASGDAAEGEKVFAKCKACHSVVTADGETIVRGGKVGPNLYGVFGRQAGTADFKYGDDMIAAGEKGLMWNEADFVSYVSDPTDFLKTFLDDSKARGKMTFKLGDEEDAADVWAYLVSVGPEPEMMESETSEEPAASN